MYANIKVQYKTYRQHPLILTRENMRRYVENSPVTTSILLEYQMFI